MDARGKEGPSEHPYYTRDDVNVVRSPFAEKVKNMTVPEISVPELLFQAIDMNYDMVKNKVWVADVLNGTSYKFSDIKPITRKIASALTRLGFKKGDVLFFVTYDAALMYLVNIGVWLCGGAVRGSFQRERKEVYEHQMREVSTRFILCDPETSSSVKWAAEQLGWNVTILSIGGEVEGALPIEEMIKNEDCSAFPKDLKINPKEDTLVIINTSGSTGIPKGVMTTHFSYVANLSMRGLPKKLEGVTGSSTFAAVGNFLASLYGFSMLTLIQGDSIYIESKFDMKSFMENLLKYKPEIVFLHPYAVHAFAQSSEIEKLDLTFIKAVITGGSVLNYATAKALEDKLPHVKLTLVYAMSEAQTVAFTDFNTTFAISNPKYEGTVAGVKYKTHQGDTHLTAGYLLPLVEAKIVDPTSGRTLGRNVKGNLLIKSSYFMKGYLTSEENKDVSPEVDKNGWFHTGDVAFFDDDDCLYVVDRSKFTFKYYMHWVSPTEVEAIILKHPAVISAVVVGVPDPVTTSAARAYVVLKPESKVTEEDIKSHVAEKTEEYKHLHGGLVFVDRLPVTAGGKLDRPALLKRAIAELEFRD